MKRILFLLIFLLGISFVPWFFLRMHVVQKDPAFLEKKPILRPVHSEEEGTFTVVSVPANEIDRIRFFYKDENGQPYGSVNALRAQVDGLRVVMNGGIFETDGTPLGLYVENGVGISPLNRDRGEGNFYLEPNGVFWIVDHHAFVTSTSEYGDAKADYAVQSGPMLVIENEINPQFQEDSMNRYVRNAVGVTEGGDVIFVLAREPVTLFELARFMKEEMQTPNALYLDGAISELFVRGEHEAGSHNFATMIGLMDVL